MGITYIMRITGNYIELPGGILAYDDGEYRWYPDRGLFNAESLTREQAAELIREQTGKP